MELPAADIYQKDDEPVFVIDRECAYSHVLMSIQRNGEEWLSPLGWVREVKSTALKNKSLGSKIEVTIPPEDANYLQDGDTLELVCRELSFRQSLSWKALPTTRASSYSANASVLQSMPEPNEPASIDLLSDTLLPPASVEPEDDLLGSLDEPAEVIPEPPLPKAETDLLRSIDDEVTESAESVPEPITASIKSIETVEPVMPDPVTPETVESIARLQGEEEASGAGKKIAAGAIAALLVVCITGFALTRNNGADNATDIKTAKVNTEEDVSVVSRAEANNETVLDNVPAAPSIKPQDVTEAASEPEVKTVIADAPSQEPVVEAEPVPKLKEDVSSEDTPVADIIERPAREVPAEAVIPKVSEPKAEPPIREPVTREQPRVAVSEMQNSLMLLGIYQGDVDGEASPEFFEAMRTFKAEKGLPVSDDVTMPFLKALRDAEEAAIAAITAAPPEPVFQDPAMETDSPEFEPEIPGPSEDLPTVYDYESVPSEGVNEDTLTSRDVNIGNESNNEGPDLIMPAKQLSSASISYPEKALDRGVDLDVDVTIGFEVTVEGRADNVFVISNDYFGKQSIAFEKEAIRAVENLKFEPKTVNGNAVTSEGHQLKIAFKGP